MRSCSSAASLADDPTEGVKERPPDQPKVKKPSMKNKMIAASSQALEETRDEEEWAKHSEAAMHSELADGTVIDAG